MANLSQSLKYNIILRSEPEGGFTVIVPALPGCITYGRDLIEAQKMAVDAIRAYLFSLKKHREPIPSDNQSFITSVELRRKSGKQPFVYA